MQRCGREDGLLPSGNLYYPPARYCFQLLFSLFQAKGMYGSAAVCEMHTRMHVPNRAEKVRNVSWIISGEDRLCECKPVRDPKPGHIRLASKYRKQAAPTQPATARLKPYPFSQGMSAQQHHCTPRHQFCIRLAIISRPLTTLAFTLSGCRWRLDVAIFVPSMSAGQPRLRAHWAAGNSSLEITRTYQRGMESASLLSKSAW